MGEIWLKRMGLFPHLSRSLGADGVPHIPDLVVHPHYILHVVDCHNGRARGNEACHIGSPLTPAHDVLR